MPDKTPPAPSSPRTVNIEIEIGPEIANGVFVNMAMINHTDTEFTLDLVYVQPQAPKANVRARVITTPRHMKRLLNAITENIEGYESRFGLIDVGSEPGFPQIIANA